MPFWFRWGCGRRSSVGPFGGGLPLWNSRRNRHGFVVCCLTTSKILGFVVQEPPINSNPFKIWEPVNDMTCMSACELPRLLLQAVSEQLRILRQPGQSRVAVETYNPAVFKPVRLGAVNAVKRELIQAIWPVVVEVQVALANRT